MGSVLVLLGVVVVLVAFHRWASARGESAGERLEGAVNARAEARAASGEPSLPERLSGLPIRPILVVIAFVAVLVAFQSPEGAVADVVVWVLAGIMFVLIALVTIWLLAKLMGWTLFGSRK